MTKQKRRQRLSESALRQVFDVRRQSLPDSWSSCTEGSVAEVGARPMDDSRKASYNLFV